MNFNDKLLKTRLSSIEHYNKEIKLLEEALSVTRSTRELVIKAIAEACILEPGDVMLRPDLTTIKIVEVMDAGLYSSGEVYLKLKYRRQASYNWETREDHFPLKDIETWQRVAVDPNLAKPT